jgi:hypothetical protein
MVTVAGSERIYGGPMMLGVYLALGVFSILIGSVCAPTEPGIANTTAATAMLR